MLKSVNGTVVTAVAFVDVRYTESETEDATLDAILKAVNLTAETVNRICFWLKPKKRISWKWKVTLRLKERVLVRSGFSVTNIVITRVTSKFANGMVVIAMKFVLVH